MHPDDDDDDDDDEEDDDDDDDDDDDGGDDDREKRKCSSMRLGIKQCYRTMAPVCLPWRSLFDAL